MTIASKIDMGSLFCRDELAPSSPFTFKVTHRVKLLDVVALTEDIGRK